MLRRIESLSRSAKTSWIEIDITDSELIKDLMSRSAKTSWIEIDSNAVLDDDEMGRGLRRPRGLKSSSQLVAMLSLGRGLRRPRGLK